MLQSRFLGVRRSLEYEHSWIAAAAKCIRYLHLLVRRGLRSSAIALYNLMSSGTA